MINAWEERVFEASSHSTRDNYCRDRARVIHSASFRRLQGKTQVLGLGESDFYRTRLTHSIEVAQVASGIVEFLTHLSPASEHSALIPSQNLIEAISLAHDIGHPPFGHGGESALNYSMQGNGGFEGNAQTLRIAAKLGEYSDDNGLNLTRRTLLGLIKYPAKYSDVVENSQYEPEKAPKNIDSYKPPKCVFDCEDEIIDFILKPFSKDDVSLFGKFSKIEKKHSKTKYKSFDTSILELADDIAYGVHDLEDGIALQLVKKDKWEDQVVGPIIASTNNSPLKNEIHRLTGELFSEVNKKRKKAISYFVGYFIRSCSISTQGEFSNNLLDLKAIMKKNPSDELEILKNFVKNNIIKLAEVQTLEYKGQQMIIRLFDALANNPNRLLPKKYHEEYEKSGRNLRVICDYLSGTTDDYATRLYHKIFTPSTGSIFDKL